MANHARKLLLRQMSPADQERFGRFVFDFVDQSGLAPPFHLIAIGSNGSVEVSLCTDDDVQQVCCSPMVAGLTAPLTVAVVSPDGRGRSARIEIVEAVGSMQ